MARVFAVTNQKGGVGKTTTVVNLGAFVAASGRRVLIVDVDPQANATGSLGYDKRALPHSVYDLIVGRTSVPSTALLTHIVRLDLLPASPALAAAEVELVAIEGREFALSRALREGIAAYDVVLIDCPPSLGLLTVNALVSADKVLIPVQCEYLALEGLVQLMDTVSLVSSRLNERLEVGGVLMTMFDRRTNLSTQVVEEVRKHFPKQSYQTIIPRSIRLSEAPSYGLTILEYDAASRGALAYQALAEEFLAREGLTP